MGGGSNMSLNTVQVNLDLRMTMKGQTDGQNDICYY